MTFMLSSCSQGSVEIYDGGNCFRTVGDGYNDYETCYISVLRDCELDVNSFSLEQGYDYLYYRSMTWTGTDGPDDGMWVDGGYQFRFTSDGSLIADGFDICCPSTPSPTMDENYDLYGGDSMKGNLYLNGQPICDNNWDDLDADVVCRKMGFDYGESTCCSSFGMVEENFIMSQVGCDGGESTIWDCQYSTMNSCNEYEGAGVECFNDDNTIEIIGGIAVLAFIICSVCFFVYCCYRCCKNNQAKQQNNQIGIQIAVAGAAQNQRVAANSFSPGISNDVPIQREGVSTNTHDVVRPARESYKPKRSNTFQTYSRPNFDSSRDEQVEGVSPGGVPNTAYETNHIELAQANYAEPVAPYGASNPSDEAPPEWTQPPSYAPPAYDPPPY